MLLRNRGLLSTRLLDPLRALLRVRLAGFGLAIVLLFIICAVFAPLIAPYDPLIQDWDINLAPSWAHPFGTDQVGRDLLSRLIYGPRVSVQAGFIAVAIGLALGVPLGLVSGYYRGRTDEVIMRSMDALIAFPGLVLALAMVAALGPGLKNVMIAIGVTSTPGFARLIRGQVLSVREMEYVTAARATGARDWRIILFHVWPNVLAPLIVAGTISVAYAVLTEASLSFLGVGVRPPTPSWGMMLNEGYPYLRSAWWLSIFPGLAIFLLVLGLNFVGDALRDVLDPRLRRTLR